MNSGDIMFGNKEKRKIWFDEYMRLSNSILNVENRLCRKYPKNALEIMNVFENNIKDW